MASAVMAWLTDVPREGPARSRNAKRGHVLFPKGDTYFFAKKYVSPFPRAAYASMAADAAWALPEPGIAETIRVVRRRG